QGGACRAGRPGRAIAAIAHDGSVTCDAGSAGITGVTAGAGLTGGGTAGAPTLAVNLAAVQSRISQACPTGQAIRAIAQDGSITCDAGSTGITGVTAGAGLTGRGATGAPSLAVNLAG